MDFLLFPLNGRSSGSGDVPHGFSGVAPGRGRKIDLGRGGGGCPRAVASYQNIRFLLRNKSITTGDGSPPLRTTTQRNQEQKYGETSPCLQDLQTLQEAGKSNIIFKPNRLSLVVECLTSKTSAEAGGRTARGGSCPAI